MNQEFIEALKMLEKERGLELDTLFTAIEEALVSAYKREFDIKSGEKRDRDRVTEEDLNKPSDGIKAEINRETGEMRVYQPITVVAEVTNPNSEILLEEARAISEDLEIGDELVKELNPKDFGRLAAQAAKNVINLRLAKAEKDRIQEEFSGRIGELAGGIVQRKDKREVAVDIGRAEAVLPYDEQSRLDGYVFNQRMKFYIMKVDERKNRPIVYVSRSHPNLVRRLFEAEVPEVSAGIVEIVSVAREAGSRTKIAVFSHDPNVDAVGACVGQRGLRVQAVIEELNGEKVDIIEWVPDIALYISNALSPAKVVRVDLSGGEEDDEDDEQFARVVVPDHVLSLAIGREGQNVRLAARLTGWKIDIKSESQYRELIENEFMSRFELSLDEDGEDAYSDEPADVPQEQDDEEYAVSDEPADAPQEPDDEE
ncbi:MAG TPA: transcription termination/antitermination protein NusA [Clostridiaceae bacterium]|nr:transcription termination/antitermination protein NusA [Clostridiaceae bacterium]